MEKLYLIGEVCRRLNISSVTLKSYEKLGYISPPKRIKRNKVRAYTLAQIEEISRFMGGV